MIRYKSITRFWQTSKDGEKLTPRCNSILFKNIGTDVAVINGIWPLNPNEETPTISQMHPDVVDETEYTINFQGNTNPLVTAIIVETRAVTESESKDKC